MRVDLNCDMGEDAGHDAELVTLATSANVACGAHAGSLATMAATVALAAQAGCAVGAHPGYPDPDNFGRVALDLTCEQVRDEVQRQVRACAEAARDNGVKLAHVKPHGALYNASARGADLARAICEGVAAVCPEALIVGLAGTCHESAAHEAGLGFRAEFFADRGYRADGSLQPRGMAGDLLDDEDTVVARTLEAVTQGHVTCVDGTKTNVSAQTVCLHGDGDHAVTFARRLREALEQAGVEVCA